VISGESRSLTDILVAEHVTRETPAPTVQCLSTTGPR
jgi:hypothetical protein